jgi:hypothetical protein
MITRYADTHSPRTYQWETTLQFTYRRSFKDYRRQLSPTTIYKSPRRRLAVFKITTLAPPATQCTSFRRVLNDIVLSCRRLAKVSRSGLARLSLQELRIDAGYGMGEVTTAAVLTQIAHYSTHERSKPPHFPTTPRSPAMNLDLPSINCTSATLNPCRATADNIKTSSPRSNLDTARRGFDCQRLWSVMRHSGRDGAQNFNYIA